FEVLGDAAGFRLRSLLSALGMPSSAILWDAAGQARLEASGSSLQDLQAEAEIALDGASAGALRGLDGAMTVRFDGSAPGVAIESLDVRSPDTRVRATGRAEDSGALAADLLFDASAPDDLLDILELLGLDLETAPFRPL